MRLIVKILTVIGILLAVPLIGALIWENWEEALGTNSLPTVQFDWLTQYGPIYLFWGGVTLAVLLIILFIVVLLWPRSRSMYIHQKADGQVTISKKAIENFTLSALRQEPYISNPKVSAKLSRNKIKLKISGNLLHSTNAKEHTSQFLTQLETHLRTWLGISTRKHIQIKIVNFDSNKSGGSDTRVI